MKKIIAVLCLFYAVVCFAQNQDIKEILEQEKRLEQDPMGVREENPEFTKVTDTFGPLVVSVGQFKQVLEDKKPWSSWWYPLWKPTLFSEEGGVSTLERYDRLVSKISGRASQAAQFEREQLHDSRAVGWAGLCNAWALASVLHPEPNQERMLQQIRFRVRDQKALLLKTYESAEGIEIFGQRNDGRWDHIYADVFPEQFHKFLQVQIFEKQTPFVMDHDASIEVWNVPVYGVHSFITKDEADPKRFHVQTWLFTASPHIDDLDFVGTKRVIKSYTYDLIGELDSEGNLKVQYGQWTQSSRWDHPDYLIPAPDASQIKRGSFNQQIYYQYVDHILSAPSA